LLSFPLGGQRSPIAFPRGRQIVPTLLPRCDTYRELIAAFIASSLQSNRRNCQKSLSRSMTTTTTTTKQRRRKRAVSMASLPYTWLGNVGLDTTPTLSGGNVQYTLNHRRGWKITRTSVLARVTRARLRVRISSTHASAKRKRVVYSPLCLRSPVCVFTRLFIHFYPVLIQLVKHFRSFIQLCLNVVFNYRRDHPARRSMKVGIYPRWFYVDDLRVAVLIASPRKSHIRPSHGLARIQLD